MLKLSRLHAGGRESRREEMGTTLLHHAAAQQSPWTSQGCCPQGRLLRCKLFPWEAIAAVCTAARTSAYCQSVMEDSME